MAQNPLLQLLADLPTEDPSKTEACTKCEALTQEWRQQLSTCSGGFKCCFSKESSHVQWHPVNEQQGFTWVAADGLNFQVDWLPQSAVSELKWDVDEGYLRYRLMDDPVTKAVRFHHSLRVSSLKHLAPGGETRGWLTVHHFLGKNRSMVKQLALMGRARMLGF